MSPEELAKLLDEVTRIPEKHRSFFIKLLNAFRTQTLEMKYIRACVRITREGMDREVVDDIKLSEMENANCTLYIVEKAKLLKKKEEEMEMCFKRGLAEAGKRIRMFKEMSSETAKALVDHILDIGFSFEGLHLEPLRGFTVEPIYVYLEKARPRQPRPAATLPPKISMVNWKAKKTSHSYSQTAENHEMLKRIEKALRKVKKGKFDEGLREHLAKDLVGKKEEIDRAIDLGYCTVLGTMEQHRTLETIFGCLLIPDVELGKLLREFAWGKELSVFYRTLAEYFGDRVLGAHRKGPLLSTANSPKNQIPRPPPRCYVLCEEDF